VRNLRLRTKFLAALLAISAGLTLAALLAVRYAVERKIRETLQQDLQASARTYQAFDRQRSEQMARTAALIADLPIVRALLTTQDEATIQDGSSGFLRLSGADMLVFANRTGQIAALHTAGASLRRSEVQELLGRSLERGEGRSWWWAEGHLFELLIEPVEIGPAHGTTLGLLALGYEVNSEAARQFKEVAASETAFLCDREIVASTLRPEQQQSLESLLRTPGLPGVPREIKLEDERYLLATLDLSGGRLPVSLAVLKSFDQETSFLRGLNRVLLGLGFVAIASGAMLAFFLSANFTRPLAQLVAGVNALERGDFAHPLHAGGDDEVGVVTRAFARMRRGLEHARQQQKEMEVRLRQAHKMEAVGRLAGGVAHDFNNLLTIIRGHADLLIDRPSTDDPARRNAEQIQKAANRAVGMTRQLLAFSRMQVLQPRVVDVNAIIAEMGKMLPRLIGEHIEFSFESDAGLRPVKADPGQIEQVLMNLAVNARDAMPDGGRLVIRTANAVLSESEAARRTAMAAGPYVIVRVSDTGQGMDEETKTHIFEPFFTTKEVGKGTGLGLATVYGIVKQSGGFIWVESTPGEGTVFEIYLPAVQGEAVQGLSGPAKAVVKTGSETILVVEDEAAVRELGCEFLRSAGYKVLEASDGQEALEVAARFSGEIHLLLTDLVMPRLGGRELAASLHATRPATKVLLVSGYVEYVREGTTRAAPDRTLLKPFDLETLTAKVREVLAEAHEPAVPGRRT
jgi:signal transduction histidine kinase/ActR/RegA family two-component response regulator